MRISILVVAALLAVVQIAPPSNAASVSTSTSIAVNSNVRDGIDALQKFVDIFNSNIFDGTPVGQVAEILSKSIGFIVTIVDLIRGGQSEDPLIKLLRQQFAAVNNRLDGISLQIQDIKNLIQWNTARSMYAQFEIEIKTASSKFDSYVKATSSEKAFRQKEFIDYFGSRRAAAFKLYQAIVDKNFVIADNLAAAAKHHTKNHRRQVIEFLLAMSRLIIRGSQMEIAYLRVSGQTSGATICENDWKVRMKSYASRMKEVEDMVKNEWSKQMNSDVPEVINQQRGLSNKDFSGFLYRFLADKFDWQVWFSAAYKDVSGTDNHFFRMWGGATFFRVAGSRNVVVGRANRVSAWSKTKAESAMAKADSEYRVGVHAETWVKAVENHFGLNGNEASLRMGVCYGCDFWYTALTSRVAGRTMTDGYYRKNVHVVLFG